MTTDSPSASPGGGCVERRVRDGIATLTLSRPPLNLLRPTLLAELRSAVGELSADRDVRAVVITGIGTFFSAGVDVRLLPELPVGERRALVEALNATFLALYRCRRPVVAAVNGHATGGGLMLALCADYRIAAPGARHGLPEVSIGLFPPVAAAEIVQASLSPPAAASLLLDGKLRSSEELHRLGAFDEISEEPAASADEVARARAGAPAEGYGEVKRQLRATTVARIEASLRAGDPLADRPLPADLPARVDLLLRAARGRTDRALESGQQEG